MPHNLEHSSGELDPAVCRAARLSRDRRFDGEFYIGVRTTGIYCRPICPARTPAEKNVTYFKLASQAAHAGFRPCLRCRPESAPASPAWAGTSTTVARAMQLIAEGALNHQGLPALAARLGVGERYLRKLFAKEIGVSPNAIAQHCRLLFARKLINESALPLTEVALAAGFGSVRRFNSAMQEHFRQTPSDLRRQARETDSDGALSLMLQYRPPYDWPGVISLFQRHQIEGVETASNEELSRVLMIGEPIRIQVSNLPAQNALRLRVHKADPARLMQVVARVRKMFDLDANPSAIAQTLGKDRYLKRLVKTYPGIRSPSYGSLHESSVRATVGQQVSIAAARNVLGKLTLASMPEQGLKHFPSAEQLLTLDDGAFPMPTRRRETLRSVCRRQIEMGDSFDLDSLAALKGIGPWTVAMVAMRGSGQTDLFPAKDLGLEKAWANLTDDSSADLYEHAERWRPWGAYAANLLWRSLTV